MPATAENGQAYGKLEFSLAKKEKEGKIGSYQNKPDLLMVKKKKKKISEREKPWAYLLKVLLARETLFKIDQ